MIYFDHAATTPIDPIVKEVIIDAMDAYGNPSSGYELGKRNSELIEAARKRIEEALDFDRGTLIFTSGGSESNNMAIRIGATIGKAVGRKKIIVSKIEHHSIIHACEALKHEGFDIDYIDVDNNGFIKIEDLQKRIDRNTALVSVMTVNNETGAIMSTYPCSSIAHKYGALFHTDAVQALPHGMISNIGNADMISFSGHKLGTPKGIGGIYIDTDLQKTIRQYCAQLIHGGGQERGLRAGTENVPYILGFAKAVEITMQKANEENKTAGIVRDYAKEQLFKTFPYILINSPESNAITSILNVSMRDVDGASIVSWMDMFDICISSGSACNTGSNKPSHVLTAMGRSEKDAFSSIRLSFSGKNTKTEVDEFIEAMNAYASRYIKQD